MWLIVGILYLATQLCAVVGFQDHLLKTCSQSGFCNRNREYAKNIITSGEKYYSIDAESLSFNSKAHSVQGIINKRINSNQKISTIPLYFSLDILDDDKIRFKLNEERIAMTENEYINANRFNETEFWVFDPAFDPVLSAYKVKRPGFWNKNTYVIKFKGFSVVFSVETFKIEVIYNSEHLITINDQSLLNFEHYRTLEQNFENVNAEEVSFNLFKDDFKDSKLDTLPFGPESVALDFRFHKFTNLYGIPEHADSLRLRDTSEMDPYRLFNVDVFKYNINSTMPMYGAVPFLIGIQPKVSIGLFWMNPSDTWVDIKYTNDDSSAHWISESGVIDFMIIVKDTPKAVTESFVEVTGKPMLPPLSSIGYHQCRWNYNDERDVLTVDSLMDKWQMPYDFIWLDLEYTDDKKFFTWKNSSFPNPKRMLTKLSRLGRNMVALIDPHLKVNYDISIQVLAAAVAVKNSLGNTFFGQCWPGESLWIDTFNPSGIKLWSKFLYTFRQNTKNLHIWNDMNEPSVFDGPETTAPKDLLHYGGFEERSVHNLYGLTVHQASFNASLELDPNSRPFILSRSFFAGSQRTAASWTGDNAATWEYLQISIPMVLSHNIVGMPFTGADISGFNGDPEDELIVRWYQAGLWYPFFRAHAHIDTKRREPYLLREPLRSMVRESIKLRYRLLPTFYTAFYDSFMRGVPVMNPMIYEHPEVPNFYQVDDQFYLGEQGIMIKPVTTANTDKVDVVFPKGIFYDLKDLKVVHNGNVETKTISAPIDTIPAFIEGGHIITRRDKYRRSSRLMEYDPFTLVITLSNNRMAKGKLYYDDGYSYSYKKGDYLEVEFEYAYGNIYGRVIHKPENSLYSEIPIEKIIITEHQGFTVSKTASIIQNGQQRYISVTSAKNMHIIDNPNIEIGQNWQIVF